MFTYRFAFSLAEGAAMLSKELREANVTKKYIKIAIAALVFSKRGWSILHTGPYWKPFPY